MSAKEALYPYAGTETKINGVSYFWVGTFKSTRKKVPEQKQLVAEKDARIWENLGYKTRIMVEQVGTRRIDVRLMVTPAPTMKAWFDYRIALDNIKPL